ncbi:MAG: NifU family protein [Hyphomicrobiales bacterium]
MFIQTETTPNPATLKFLPGRDVLTGGSADFRSLEEAAMSPLATRLFEVEGIASVFLGPDFISVTKGNGDWQYLRPAVLGAIMEHFMSGAPVVHGAGGAADHSEGGSEDEELVAAIKELLDTRVRPAVAQDGGDITFHSYQQGVVFLEMRGACSGCPSATATLKNGVENLLRHFIPEIREVRAI